VDLAGARREDIEAYLGGLLATCAGKDFEARRDRALILLLLDTGGRRAEIGGMRPGDVNVESDVLCPAEAEPRAALEFVHDREGTRERSGRAWRRCAGPGWLG
jgi:integrase